MPQLEREGRKDKKRQATEKAKPSILDLQANDFGTTLMKTYLNVPVQEKEQAKRLGARFDWAKKQWFVPDGIDVANFLPWLPVALSKDVRKVLRQRV